MVNKNQSVYLLSSAGRRVELCSLLKKNGTVVSVDAHPFVPSRESSDFFRLVPRLDDEEFIDVVVGICEEFGVDFIIPTIDTELKIYSVNKERFSAIGIDVWVSASEAVRLAADKYEFARWLETQGLPFIPTQLLEDLDKGVETFPCFVKPRWGSSSQGASQVDSIAELALFSGPQEMVVQPLVEGTEFTIDFAVNQYSELVGISCRERLRVRDGEVVTAATRNIPELEDLVVFVVESLPGLYGLLNLQVILSGERFRILEMNARVGGGYPLSAAAGCNLFEAMLEGPGQKTVRPEFDVVMLRHDSSFFVRERDWG